MAQKQIRDWLQKAAAILTRSATQQDRRDDAKPVKDGYASWLELYGTDAKAAYAKAARAADITYDRAGSRYGARGEAVARAGLTGSGYGDYLDGVAYATHARALADAAEKQAETARQNRRDYADYLTAESKRRQSLLGSIKGQGITDEATAEAYARACGMSDGDAAVIGTLVGKMRESGSGVSVHQKVKVMQYMVNQEMPREVAYSYALTCGMTEQEAREMAEATEAAVNAKNKNLIHYH